MTTRIRVIEIETDEQSVLDAVIGRIGWATETARAAPALPAPQAEPTEQHEEPIPSTTAETSNGLHGAPTRPKRRKAKGTKGKVARPSGSPASSEAPKPEPPQEIAAPTLSKLDCRKCRAPYSSKTHKACKEARAASPAASTTTPPATGRPNSMGRAPVTTLAPPAPLTPTAPPPGHKGEGEHRVKISDTDGPYSLGRCANLNCEFWQVASNSVDAKRELDEVCPSCGKVRRDVIHLSGCPDGPHFDLTEV